MEKLPSMPLIRDIRDKINEIVEWINVQETLWQDDTYGDRT